jgi:quercetin dioxygenase-like cupin family protein
MTQITIAPPVTKDVTIKQLGAIDLRPEIEGIGDRQLRMRKVTIQPGGFFAIHGHEGRPGTAYVLEGKVTEQRGDFVREYGPGEGWLENKETTHRLDNKGMTPAVVIGVDIFEQQ